MQYRNVSGLNIPVLKTEVSGGVLVKGDCALEGAVPHGQHYIVHFGPLEDVMYLKLNDEGLCNAGVIVIN